MNNITSEIAAWYAGECNGDWEHSFGVKIETLDNPGWLIEIDLAETHLAGRGGYKMSAEISESDWIDVKIDDSKFSGTGDPSKLHAILTEFLTFRMSVVGEPEGGVR